MDRAILSRCGRFGQFIWSAWAGLAGLALFAALWQAGNEVYGDFILPSPQQVAISSLGILSDRENWHILWQTIRRAAQGFALAALMGCGLGIMIGQSPASLRLSRSILTVLLAVPPIAWIVLAMIWFGSTDGTVIVTVLIAVTPAVFVSAAEGIVTRDRGLDDMAKLFGASSWQRLCGVGLRHMASYVLPALSIALGSSIKVAVMAELLSNIGGIGGALAMSRSNLDVSGALAWILLAVLAVIGIEYTILHPIRAEMEKWRDAARPWGVKR